jgi:RNA polymerase sigma-70 factor (ECF subfamily)
MLLQCARMRGGDESALAELFERHRDRLRRMVELRMDVCLRGRVDASGVLQDAFLDAAVRVNNFLSEPHLSAFLWLRLVVSERLTACHHRHLGANMRDAGREVSLYCDPMPSASSVARGEG